MARKNRYDAPFRPSLDKPPADDATEVTIRGRRGLLPVDDETNFGEGKGGSELEEELLKVDPRALAQRLARARTGRSERPAPRRSLPEDQPTTLGPSTEGPSIENPVPLEDPVMLARRLAREAKARLGQTDDLNDETARSTTPGRPRTKHLARPEKKASHPPARPRVSTPQEQPATRTPQRPRVVRQKARPRNGQPPARARRTSQPDARVGEETQKRADARRDAERKEAERREARRAELDRLEKLNRVEEARRERARRDEARENAPTPKPPPSRPTPMPAPPRRTQPPERAKAPPVPRPDSPAAPEVGAPPPEDPAALAVRLAAEAKARIARSATPPLEREATPTQNDPVVEPAAPSTATPAEAREPATPPAPAGRLAARAPRPKKKTSAAETVKRLSAEPAPARSYTPPTGARAEDLAVLAPAAAAPVAQVQAPEEARPLGNPLSLLAATLPGVLIESEHQVTNAEVFQALWEAHQARAIRAGRLSLAATATLLLDHVGSGRPLVAARIGYASKQWAAFMAADNGQLLAIVEMPEIYLAGIR